MMKKMIRYARRIRFAIGCGIVEFRYIMRTEALRDASDALTFEDDSSDWGADPGADLAEANADVAADACLSYRLEDEDPSEILDSVREDVHRGIYKFG